MYDFYLQKFHSVVAAKNATAVTCCVKTFRFKSYTYTIEINIERKQSHARDGVGVNGRLLRVLQWNSLDKSIRSIDKLNSFKKTVHNLNF